MLLHSMFIACEIQRLMLLHSMFIACDSYLVVCCRWQCQYGLKDKFDADFTVSADKLLSLRKYNQKGKCIMSGCGQKGPHMTNAQEGGSIKWGC